MVQFGKKLCLVLFCRSQKLKRTRNKLFEPKRREYRGLLVLGSLFLLLVGFLVFPFSSWAVSEGECKKAEEEERWDDAEKCWQEYFGAKKRTLRNEIDSKTIQVELTVRKIAAAQQNIRDLETEIEKLGMKISRLDISLDELSEILIERINETYKKGQIDPLTLFLSSEGFSDFVARYKYLRVIQLHDRRIMLQMEAARTNYEGQKTLKEAKQEELEAWHQVLEREKVDLAQAVAAKRVLLNETEASYQKVMARIAAEKAKLGGASVFGKPAEFKQWSEDNFYFNQTDVRWAMMLIGGGVYYDPTDPSYMWKYGCAVTAMASVLKRSGVETNPASLSQSPIYIRDLMAWQDVPGQFGGSIKVVGHGYGGVATWEEIDSHLAAGRWVIVYIQGVKHYVTLLNKEGDDYKMHDPYFGPNLSFNSRYSKGAVDELIVYTR